ncbi:ankyrin repeat-containing domain protein [Aspergillus coremiiformis]|uniref:Ankyrin repeat-containing domain protein n=1 Tax=Aspergillus coremiiformis TaxID=138285 RepID=A0A5N6Z5T5_9EURO|nr:ankyrin repeat-containing domain protein [Aspergillus coremiiformis]
MNGSSSVIEALLPYRVNVNHVDFYCRTALSLAAEGGFPDVIKLLLGQAEIDLEISDRMGRTSLTWAAQGGNMEVVKLLTEAGADVVKGDKSGRTPLSWVLEYGHTKLIKYLIKISP